MTTQPADLLVAYLGESWTLTPEQSLSFGRDADLVVDDNPYLHRIAGEFRHEAGAWVLENVGSRIVLTLRGAGPLAATTVPPGQQVRLIDRSWSVSFTAGPTNYQLEGEVQVEGPLGIGTTTASGSTQRFGVVDLTDDQRIAVVALAQRFLRGELNPSVPSNKEIAGQLNWTSKAVQRKVDNLADKLTQAGVPGLKGSEGASAARRRERIVEHMVRQQLVDVDDLSLLD